MAMAMACISFSAALRVSKLVEEFFDRDPVVLFAIDFNPVIPVFLEPNGISFAHAKSLKLCGVKGYHTLGYFFLLK